MTRTPRTAITLRMPPELAAALNAGYHRAALDGYPSPLRSYNAWLADQVGALARRPYSWDELTAAPNHTAEPTMRLAVRLPYLLLEQCRAVWREHAADIEARQYPYAIRPPSLNAWLVLQMGALVRAAARGGGAGDG